MEPRVVKCPICKALYYVYAHMVGDQSVCPKCRMEAARNSQARQAMEDGA